MVKNKLVRSGERGGSMKWGREQFFCKKTRHRARPRGKKKFFLPLGKKHSDKKKILSFGTEKLVNQGRGWGGGRRHSKEQKRRRTRIKDPGRCPEIGKTRSGVCRTRLRAT